MGSPGPRSALTLSGALLLLLIPPRSGASPAVPLQTDRDVVWLPTARVVLGTDERAAEATLRECRRDPLARALDELCDKRTLLRREPRRQARVGRFGLDRLEVTLARWFRCVRAGRCRPPRLPEGPDLDPRLPVTGVTWHEAADYCAFAGGRLPTAEEWERAARGPNGRRYPWGDRFHPRAANLGASGGRPSPADGALGLRPVDAFAADRTPEGVVGLAGNVAEWTATAVPDVRPVSGAGPLPAARGVVVKGGSWRSPAWQARGAAWTGRLPGQAYEDVGVRCAYEAPPASPRRSRRR